MFRLVFAVIVCSALVFSGMADGRAEDAPLNLGLYYEVTWNDIHIADFQVSLNPAKGDPNAAEMCVVIRTGSIASLAGGYASDTRARLHYTGAESYKPVRYHTAFKLKKKARDIKLHYNAEGNRIAAEINTPPENPGKRAKVSATQKKGALDPLALVLAARERLIKLTKGVPDIAGKNFTLPMYDGRRRSDMRFDVQARMADGIIPVSVTEIAVAGYSKSELEDRDKARPLVTLYISPERYIPVRAQGASFFGTSWVKLVKECATAEACVK